MKQKISAFTVFFLCVSIASGEPVAFELKWEHSPALTDGTPITDPEAQLVGYEINYNIDGEPYSTERVGVVTSHIVFVDLAPRFQPYLVEATIAGRNTGGAGPPTDPFDFGLDVEHKYLPSPPVNLDVEIPDCTGLGIPCKVNLQIQVTTQQ